jgi:hypothetical protein
MQLKIRQEDGGCVRQGNLIHHQDLETSVRGEASVLTALGVPSLLLLPGFLMIATIGLLWRLGFRVGRASATQFPLQTTDPTYWVVVIALSLLLTASPLIGRDLSLGYGLHDIKELWLRSLGLAAASWLVLVAGARLPLLFWRKTFGWSAEDDPVTVLQKLGRRGRGTVLQRVALGGETGYLLLADGRRPWLCPPIAYCVPNNSDAVRARINAALAQNSARRLAQVLVGGAREKAVSQIRWVRGDGPVRAASGEITRYDATPIVLEDGAADNEAEHR